MVIADKLKSTLKKTREEMASNFDPKDKEFVDLYNELKRIFANKNLDEISQEEMTTNIDTLEKIYEAITDLNRRNNLLKDKYKGDQKYARIHKRILENPHLNLREIVIHESLMEIKQELDDKVLQNKNIVTNESYFEQMTSPIVDKAFGNRKIDLDFPSLQSINQTTIKEYIQEMVF